MGLRNLSNSSVFIIILNWNRHQDTRICLLSLRESTYSPIRVVVVDNGSTIPGLDQMLSEFPEVHLIQLDQNLGFSKGNNLGIQFALQEGADYVVLMNNDTIVHPNFLSPLILTMEGNPSVGAASGTILEFDYQKTNRIWYAGGRLSKIRGEGIRFHLGENFVQDSSIIWQETGYLTGCFLALRRKTIDMVGMLDEDFFFGTEDLEISWRLQKYGICLAYIPTSIIWHRGGRSRSFTPAEIYRAYLAKILLMRKHLCPLIYRSWLFLFLVYMAFFGLFISFFRLKRSGFDGTSNRLILRAILRSLRDGWSDQLDTKRIPPEFENSF